MPLGKKNEIKYTKPYISKLKSSTKYLRYVHNRNFLVLLYCIIVKHSAYILTIMYIYTYVRMYTSHLDINNNSNFLVRRI